LSEKNTSQTVSKLGVELENTLFANIPWYRKRVYCKCKVNVILQ